MAAGSRAKMRQRMRVSCQSGCWRSVVCLSWLMLIAELAASQVDEDVFESGVVGGQASQCAAGLLKMAEQEWQSFMQLLDGERQPIISTLDRMHARQGAHGGLF